MKPILTSICAASLTATPAVAAVTPEAFVDSMRSALAGQAAAIALETVTGTIAEIDAETSSLVLNTTDDEPVTVRLGEKTEYLLDGKRVERDEALKKGRKATVTHADGLASRVEVSTTAPPA